jgi:hypothetical protein
MKVSALLLALVLAPAALANERADSEARLAALADQIIPALAAAMPQVPGMDCTPADPDPSPTNRLLFPHWSAECRLQDQDAKGLTLVSLTVAASTSDWYRDKIADLAATDAEGYDLIPADAPRIARWSGIVQAALSPSIAAYAEGRGEGKAEAIDRLASALSAIDTAPLESLPEVQAHVAALADHRALLATHRLGLEAALTAAIPDAVPEPPLDGVEDTPDFMFFAAMPMVQTKTVESGVTMIVRITTASLALETAAANGQFFGNHADKEISGKAVFHDRGRVQLYLQDDLMTALIDERGMLIITVMDKAPGTDPVAAMEAVLARIAATDFSGY